MNKEEKIILDDEKQARNYSPLIWVLSILAVIIIIGTNYIPRSTTGTIGGVDLTVLPLLNAILNGIAFLFLIGALVSIKKKNIKVHRRFIYADRKSTRLNSSHVSISYAVFCLQKKT